MAKTRIRGSNVPDKPGFKLVSIQELNDLNDAFVKVDELSSENATLKTDLDKKKSLIKTLNKKLSKAESSLAELQRKKAGRSCEAKQDVKESIDTYIKHVTFRNVKFAPPGDQLTTVACTIYAALKAKNLLDDEDEELLEQDFVDIYSNWILHCLSERRNYVQARARNGAEGKKQPKFCLIYTKRMH